MGHTVAQRDVWQNQQKPSLLVVLGSGPAYDTSKDPFRLGRHAQFFVSPEPGNVIQKVWQLTFDGYPYSTDVHTANAKIFTETNPPWINEYKPSPRSVTDFIQNSDIFGSHDTFGWPEYPYPPVWVNEQKGSANVLQFFPAYNPAGDIFLLKKQEKFFADPQVIWNKQPIFAQHVSNPYVPYLNTLQLPQAKVQNESNPAFIDFSQKPGPNAIFNFATYNPATDVTRLKPPAKFFQDPQIIWGPQPLTQNILIFLPPTYNPATDVKFPKQAATFIDLDRYINPMRSARIVWDVPQIIPPPPTFLAVVQNWQGRVVLSPKKVGETVFVPMDFISRLSTSETIATAVCTCSLYSGVDPNPSAMIVGAAAINGTVVEQEITGGIIGNIYELLFTIVTSLGQTLELSGYFAVEPDVP